jgi:2-polyprenyl-6-methoxyphenol hydroxylase-like FAD-dependent oxidoreductase
MGRGHTLIVGAGIAGCALALRRAAFDIAVYEARPQPEDDAGVILNVAPNGLAVLQVFGLRALHPNWGSRTTTWRSLTGAAAAWPTCRWAAST